MKKFCDELADAISASGLTMRAISDTLGIPYRTIQDWKAGRRVPTQFQQHTILEAIKKIK